jgi:nucleotide-binding universal stress UspA family protein
MPLPGAGEHDAAEGGSMKHVLVAVDGSPGSRPAVTEGIELARTTGAHVTFLAVRRPIHLLGKPHYQRKLTDQLARIRPALMRAKLSARQVGVEADTEIQEGDVIEEILRVAVYRDSDLIVVGSRGLGPIAGAVRGSVSKALVELSPIPVLVAKPRVEEPLAAAGV